MKNRDILENLIGLKKSECIHTKFNYMCFNIGAVIDSRIANCKTSGCLAGELPALTDDWYFNINGELICKHYDAEYTLNSPYIYDFKSALTYYFDVELKYILAIFYLFLSEKPLAL